MTRLLRSGDRSVDRLLELGHRHRVLLAAGGEQRGLVHDVGQVRAGEPGGASREHPKVDGRVERDASDVHLQDLLAPLQVGLVDHHLAVEPSRPHERRVQDVGPVRRGHDDDALLGVEPVHLDQELVQRLLAFVVAPEPGAQRATAPLADRVDLVEEDQRRRLLLGLLEELADAGGAEADEHLDELRAGHEEERHVGLAGDRARE
jgi:hypothetical protein